MAYGVVNADKMTTSDGVSSSGLYGFKNRIINGAMVIDQRNAGASVSNTGAVAYTIDRWYSQGVSSAGVFSCQQVTDAPTGFSYSEKLTVTTNSTPSGTQAYKYIQRIEGYNLADFNLGLSTCASFTLSFWVKSSLTGTFGGSFWGAGATRWFVFSYTINSANTWEYKTVTVTPITSGSFDTTNGIGLQLTFNIGAGSSSLTTANAWNSGSTEYYGPTGQTNIIATNGATWQIAGVQLEKGSTATSFDYRPYGQELMLCQRYTHVWTSGGSSYCQLAVGYTQTNSANTVYKYPQIMRATPTATFSEQNKWLIDMPATSVTTTSISIGYGTPEQTRILPVVASGVTSGNPCAVANNGDAGTRTIIFSAEL
jgi:hypothetical protein